MNNRERHFFLHSHSKQIYTVEYLPEATQDNRQAVILCKPIWGERIRTHSIFSNLARLLADKGFTVVTCDYYGDGNSGGETLDLNYPSMVDDIDALHAYLLDKNEFRKLFLVGLRLGANVAISAQPRISKLEKMVLFEPVANPNNLFKDALLANLTTQMAMYKKVIKNREQLIEDIKNDKPVNVDGFIIGKEFWQSFEKISPFTVEPRYEKAAVFYSLVAPRRKGADYSTLARNYMHGETKSIEREFDWTGWKSYVPKPVLFFDAVESELKVL